MEPRTNNLLMNPLLICLLFIGLGLESRSSAGIGLELEHPASIGLYDTVTLRIDFDRRFKNPFDPSQADVTVQLLTPSGETLTVPAFYDQPYELRTILQGNRNTDWIYPAGDAQWRVRFAPRQTGLYTATAVLNEPMRSSRSQPVTFVVEESRNRGFIQVSQNNPRLLAFEDGSPFFAIGQNAAFVWPTQYLSLSKIDEVFESMAAHGANFARVWVCSEDWALAIEARKSAWGRSWDWKPPFVAPPGRDAYHSDGWAIELQGGLSLSPNPTHPLALRPDTGYALTGEWMKSGDSPLLVNGQVYQADEPNRWRKFVYEFTTGPEQWWFESPRFENRGNGSLWLRRLSLSEAQGGPELFPELNVDLPARGYYHSFDSFVLDRIVKSAERHGIYLQLVLLTRDHYRSALNDPQSPAYRQAVADARNLLRYAVARWGASTHVAVREYFNEQDPNLPTDLFYQELGDYLETIDPYRHLKTTSAWGPSIKDWRHERLDLANEHFYMRPSSGDLWKDEAQAVWERSQEILGHTSGKPAMLAEFGLADDRWGLSPYMKQDAEGIHFRRTLWASAFSGLSGSAMFWWWETIDQHRLYRHYQPLSDFMNGIPFSTSRLEPFHARSNNDKCRIIGLRDDVQVHAWISDPAASWYAQIVDKKPPQPVSGETVRLEGMRNGTYRIQWWDTQRGGNLGESAADGSNGMISIEIPEFVSDIACRVAWVR